MTDEKQCFVVSPIGEEDSSVRERADKLLNHIIEPAVSDYGYNAVRADYIDEPGIITSQVINAVVESPLVVADLTDSNPNVFYELAVRHASQKPLIQMVRKGENIPFDVASTRVIKFDLEDIRAADEAKEKIRKQVENIESNDDNIETPISNALNLRDLKESGDPEEQTLAEAMESISELRSTVINIQNQLGDPEALLPPDYFDYLLEEVSKKRDKGVTEKMVGYLGESKEAAEYLYRFAETHDLSEEENMEELKEIHADLLHSLENLDNQLRKIRHADTGI